MSINTGSICSGIEAATAALQPLGFNFSWYSETAEFPSALLKHRYPGTPNVGDMLNIESLLESGQINTVDFICGGTPCQSFSCAGRRQGLNDDRGNLALQFISILNINDSIRHAMGLAPAAALWENVEGVLTDKTNAFGCFISALAQLDSVISLEHYPKSGILHSRYRNTAWRVLDAKYFGIPQQRRRLYLLTGGPEFYPERILFSDVQPGQAKQVQQYESAELTFIKADHVFHVFRDYTDCLYSSYGTKWNGNAAAYNGSLFIQQDGRLRRLSPLECERLMGFPDNYTDIPEASKTARYKALGNSWAVPVIKHIGQQLLSYYSSDHTESVSTEFITAETCDYTLYDLDSVCTAEPADIILGRMQDIAESYPKEDLYLSAAGCRGILRRAEEQNKQITESLYLKLKQTAEQE